MKNVNSRQNNKNKVQKTFFEVKLQHQRFHWCNYTLIRKKQQTNNKQDTHKQNNIFSSKQKSSFDALKAKRQHEL